MNRRDNPSPNHKLEGLSAMTAAICDIRLQRGTLRDLKICLQKKEDFWKEQCISMTAGWEAEKVAASELQQETLQVKLHIQDEWQKKVKKLEEQLSHRDAVILTLRKEKTHLTERLTSNQLSRERQ
eukprot:superscaffoldBa00004545_g19066